MFPSSANTLGMPGYGGFSLVTRAAGWFWSWLPLIWVSEAKSNSILCLLMLLDSWSVLRWGHREESGPVPDLQGVNNPPTDYI